MRYFIGIFIIFYNFFSYGQIFRGENNEIITAEDLAREVNLGDILVIGEEHGRLSLSHRQVQILKSIKKLQVTPAILDVGMEFLSYPDQNWVNLFISQQIDESVFLKEIQWGAMDFRAYRSQILFPDWSQGEKTWALNAPRSLTSQIAKKGLESLTSDQKALLPPNFTLGNLDYKKRFEEIMEGHIPSESLEKYFQAQSVWDDTMAWKVSEIGSDRILVIIVGQFHVEFGGGLPDRLKARLSPQRKVIKVVQNSVYGLSSEEKNQLLQKNPRWGARADFIEWVDEPDTEQAQQNLGQGSRNSLINKAEDHKAKIRQDLLEHFK